MIEDSGSGVQDVLSRNVRRVRIARHLSLSQLARATAVGKATLSAIENGRANPTLDTLVALAAALHVAPGELLQEPAVEDVRVVRARGAQPPDRAGRRLLDAVALRGEIAIFELRLGSGQEQRRGAGAAGSRAHVFVLSGRLIAGPVGRISELGAGDYASFPADVPHEYEAPRAATRALLLEQSG